MKIELLYFEGCPSYEGLLPVLKRLLGREGVASEIELHRIETPEAAEKEEFLGSPTLLIDGEDVQPGAGDRSDYGLKCRLYPTDEGLSGVPPESWIVESIRRHLA
ncbi:MAG: hypothetical protein JJE13_12880 [Thermoleophilia bacterium]|nr:hypothetical protein [Thermoleophilia bacterium]